MNQMIVKKDAWEVGYQKFALMDRIVDLGLQDDFEELKAEYSRLQPDDYDKLGLRSRSYVRGHYYGWLG